MSVLRAHGPDIGNGDVICPVPGFHTDAPEENLRLLKSAPPQWVEMYVMRERMWVRFSAIQALWVDEHRAPE